MAAPSIAEVRAHVTVGVDTHKHSHLGSAKDELGRTLGQLEIPTNPRGYADLLTWARSLGRVVAFGVEGTSSYGAGLKRFLCYVTAACKARCRSCACLRRPVVLST
jgi:hypothetical protein